MKGSVTRQTPKHLLKWTAIDSHLFHSGWCCSSSYICICDGLFVIWPGRTASQLHRLPRTGTSRTGCYRMLSSCLCFKQVSRKQQSCEWPLAELAASLLQSCDIRKKSSLCSHLFVCQLLALTIFKTTRIMKARCFQVQHKDSIKISWHCSMNISFLRVHLCFHVVHVADMTPSSILLSDPPPPHAFPPFPFLMFSVTDIFHLTKLGTNSNAVFGVLEKIFSFQAPLMMELEFFWECRFHSENQSSVFRPYYAREIWNATISGHFGFLFGKTRAGKSRHYRDVTVFKKFRFWNVLRPHKNEKPAFSNSSDQF